MRLGKYHSHFDFTKKKCSNNQLQAATSSWVRTTGQLRILISLWELWTELAGFSRMILSFAKSRLAQFNMKILSTKSRSTFPHPKSRSGNFQKCPKLGHQNESRYSKLISQSKRKGIYRGQSRAFDHLKRLKLYHLITKMNHFE